MVEVSPGKVWMSLTDIVRAAGADELEAGRIVDRMTKRYCRLGQQFSGSVAPFLHMIGVGKPLVMASAEKISDILQQLLYKCSATTSDSIQHVESVCSDIKKLVTEVRR